MVDCGDPVDSGDGIDCAEGVACGVVFRDVSFDDGPTGGVDSSEDTGADSVEVDSVDSLVELLLWAPRFGDGFSTADWIAGVAAIFSADVVSLSGLTNALPVLLVLAGTLLALMLSLADCTAFWLCPVA
jgi:hypothetical protein